MILTMFGIDSGSISYATLLTNYLKIPILATSIDLKKTPTKSVFSGLSQEFKIIFR